MSNFMQADLPSDEESDEDFNPAADEGGEAEDRAQLRAAAAASRASKRSLGSGGGGGTAPNRFGVEEEEELQGASKRQRLKAAEAFEQLKGASAQAAEKEQGAEKGQAADKWASRKGQSIASLCRPLQPLNTSTAFDDSWKVHLGLQQKAVPAGTASPQPASGPPESKSGKEASAPEPGNRKRGMDVAAVLSSLRAKPSAAAAGRVSNIVSGAQREEGGGSGEGSGKEAAVQPAGAPLAGKATRGKSAAVKHPALSAAGAALAAAKAAASVRAASDRGKVTVSETRRFAGQNIQVQKQVTEEEREAEKKARNKAGLDAVLASLQSAKKVNVLDKSRQDWSVYKKSNEEVEVELDTYQKSGSQYLDKVDFLKRAELKEYEQERDARLRGDIRNRGRL